MNVTTYRYVHRLYRDLVASRMLVLSMHTVSVRTREEAVEVEMTVILVLRRLLKASDVPLLLCRVE